MVSLMQYTKYLNIHTHKAALTTVPLITICDKCEAVSNDPHGCVRAGGEGREEAEGNLLGNDHRVLDLR